MIIDEQAEFRSLLMHHVTAHWPDAVVSAYDPVVAGHLPDEFAGAGNDVVLLGSRHGEDRDGVEVLARFKKRRRFPPVIYFGTSEDNDAAAGLAPDAYFDRDALQHEALISRLESILDTGRHSVAGANQSDVNWGDDVMPRIRGYRVERKLSVTDYSGVYLAERNGAKVALKVLRALPGTAGDTALFDRFLQEYEAIAEVDHPNVVRIFDLGVCDEHAHIAMEYLDAGDLGGVIKRGLTEQEAVAYLRQIASALAAVHRSKVLHRDLKPANIMLRRDGSVALIDFGLAKRAKLQAAITDKGEIFGTPFYMSPEQGHGNAVDERSDIYSLGVVFYELLAGEKPFQANDAMGIIFKHAHEPIPLLPRALGRYQGLVDRMLAKRPSERLSSAAEILKWL